MARKPHSKQRPDSSPALGPIGKRTVAKLRGVIPNERLDGTRAALALVEHWARTGDALRSAVTRGERVLRSILSLSSEAFPDAGARESIAEILELAEKRRKALRGAAVPTELFAELASVETKEVEALGAGQAIPGAIAKRLLGSSVVALRSRAAAKLPMTLEQVELIAGPGFNLAMNLWRKVRVPLASLPQGSHVDGATAARARAAVGAMEQLHWTCGHPRCKEQLERAALCYDHARMLAAGELLAPRRSAASDVYVLSPLMLRLMAEGQLAEREHHCFRPGCQKPIDDLMLVVCKQHYEEWQQHRPPMELLLQRRRP